MHLENHVMSFFFFNCSLLAQENKIFLEHQNNPMTYETLGDLVGGSLDLAFEWKLGFGFLGVKQSFLQTLCITNPKLLILIYLKSLER